MDNGSSGGISFYGLEGLSLYLVIAGLALATLVLIMSLILCICFCCCRRGNTKPADQEDIVSDNTSKDTKGYTFSYGQEKGHKALWYRSSNA